MNDDEKAGERRRKSSDIEASLKISEERCDSSPTPENQEEFEWFIMEHENTILSMNREQKVL